MEKDMKLFDIQRFAEGEPEDGDKGNGAENEPKDDDTPKTVAQEEYDKLKAQFDRVASEIADYKKKERARMTEEEQKLAEYQEREEYYKRVERENNFIKTKAMVAQTITDEKIANEVAELLVDGKAMQALEKQNAFLAQREKELEKKIKEELLKTNPEPAPDKGKGKKTIADYTMDQLNKLKETDPVEYKRLLS